jgi:hypothetical protein
MMQDTEKLIRYFETLGLDKVAEMGDHYAKDAYFCDPFNEVHCLQDIQAIFIDMFHKLDQPAFKITDVFQTEQGVVLVWDFNFNVKLLRVMPFKIRGNSVLKFNAQGKVSYHRDYWDSSAELYAKLPLIGFIFRGLRLLFSSKS